MQEAIWTLVHLLDTLYTSWVHPCTPVFLLYRVSAL